MKKPVYLGMSILDICKILTYKFWYDHVKPEYQGKAKLCQMDTESFIIHIKTGDFLKILRTMLKNGLTHQIKMILIDHSQKV